MTGNLAGFAEAFTVPRINRVWRKCGYAGLWSRLGESTPDLSTTSVFLCDARGFKSCASFKFTGCAGGDRGLLTAVWGHLGDTHHARLHCVFRCSATRGPWYGHDPGCLEGGKVGLYRLWP